MLFYVEDDKDVEIILCFSSSERRWKRQWKKTYLTETAAVATPMI